MTTKKAVKTDTAELTSKRSAKALAKTFQEFADAYRNTRRARRKADLYEDEEFIPHPTWTQLRTIGRRSWIVQRACKVVVEDAVKNWIDMTDSEAAGETKLKEVKDMMTKFDFKQKLIDAYFQCALQGGSGIFLGVLDGAAIDKKGKPIPLDTKKVTSLEALSVISMPWIMGQSPYSTNPMNPYYGKAENYRLTDSVEVNKELKAMANSGQLYHASRFMLFSGTVVDKLHRMERWGFGDSSVYSAMEALKTFGITTAGVEDIFLDFTTKIFKLQGFIEKLISAEGRANLTTRMTLFNESLSNDALALVGDGEEFTKISHNVSGMKDFLTFAIDLVSGAFCLPKTKLFGQQLGTLAGADESGADYDDRVKRCQDVLMPHIDVFLDIAYQVTTGKPRPSTMQWKWNPLESPTFKEQVEIQAIASNSVRSLYEINLLTEEEARTVLSSKSENWLINVDPKKTVPPLPVVEKTTPPAVKPVVEPVIK